MTNPRNNFEIRPITEDDFDAWICTSMRAFGEHPTPDSKASNRAITEIGRSIVVFDGADIVGTATALSFGLTIPGGVLPLPLVDSVAVQPTHRRRGILRAMMAHQMADFHKRGEIIAGLFVSESGIYEQFGYGVATWCEDWTMLREYSAFSDQPFSGNDFRFVDPDDIATLWSSIYERAQPDRVGFFRFPEPKWPAFAADPEHKRLGATASFHIVYSGESGDEGFVTYRIRDGSQVFVVMLFGATPAAEAALWQFCFRIDLMTSTFAPSRPVDDPLPWMLKDPRRLKRSVRDQLWLRLVDVAAAMEARSYASESSVVLGVRDSFCPWNERRYVFETAVEGATCTPTNRSPEIEISAAELASVYLGGVTLDTLRRAARVVELRAGAVADLDRALVTARKPWTVIF
ncbi:MAG: GNAT family N-acetyltransferase [SAR202 cluster bacterium]|nr:GNAT family N-acetyltransferase [SAR202 cluster bacterium]